MIKNLLANKNRLFFITLVGAIFVFLVETIVLIFYRETWFDELNYLWKSCLIVGGDLIPFRDAILEYPPLFVPIYGLGQVLFGPSFYIGRITSVIIFAFLLFFVFLIVKKLGNKWWALGAIFLILSNILLVGNYVSATLYSLATFLLVLVFWIETLDINRKKKIYFSGIVLGLMMLVRINLLPVVFIFFGYLIFTKARWRDILLFFILMFVVIFIGYLPIVLPNPQVAIGHILQPLHSFGIMKELPSVGMVGGQSLSSFFSTLIDFLKEYYSFLLLFFAIIFYVFFENYKNIKNFLKKEKVFLLISLTALVLIATHFFYWRLQGKVYYANYFIPLVAVSVTVGMSRFLSKNKAVVIFFIFSLLLNFSVNLYRTDVVSSPMEESDLERVARGAELLIKNTQQGDKVLAFDNSIFHVFMSERTHFPLLMNRNFLYAPALSLEKAEMLKFYNFEMLRHWFLQEADYVAINKERWNLPFIKNSHWGPRDEGVFEKVREIEKIIDDNYELVGVAENVYPRKYTDGNDEGTLLLYKRIK